MRIECPHCQYSKEVANESLPALPANVTCPQCSQSFTLEAQDPEPAFSDEPLLTEDPTPAVAPPAAPTPPPAAAMPQSAAQPAGFWLRVLASIIDGVLLQILSYAMLFGLQAVMGGINFETDPTIALVLLAMSMVVSVAYYVFFTGYNGQTPGKMALRVKVIDNDGGPVGYGQAFVREVVGKFLSSLILCIGYLMVAFRADKRGLHDLVARTRVIKL